MKDITDCGNYYLVVENVGFSNFCVGFKFALSHIYCHVRHNVTEK